MCRLPLSGLAVAPGGAALSAAHVTQLSAPGAAPGKPASGRGQYDDEFLQFSYKVRARAWRLRLPARSQPFEFAAGRPWARASSGAWAPRAGADVHTAHCSCLPRSQHHFIAPMQHRNGRAATTAPRLTSTILPSPDQLASCAFGPGRARPTTLTHTLKSFTQH